MNTTADTLTPGTLIDGARMYAASADAVNEQLPNALHVLSHLLCTGIELALKAYLRRAGYSEMDLRSLGHDLKQMLDHGAQNGLVKTGIRNFVLAVAGHNYRERIFVYPEIANMQIIMPCRFRQMADELIAEVFTVIHGQAEYDKLKGEPGLAIHSLYPEDLDASAWAQ